MKIKIGLSIFLLFTFYFPLSTYVFGQSVADITSKFCNNGILTEDLNFSTDSAKLNELCIQFTNDSDKDISINIGFPDGTITNDSFKNKACKAEGNIENFGKYIIQKNKTIIIPSQKTIIKRDYIRFPAGFQGISHGCLTYFLNQKNSALNNSVNVITRKTSHIDILVGSNFKRDIHLQAFNKINNGGSNKKINTEFNLDSTISIKLNFINIGDIDELFEGTGKIYDNFGFSKDFEIKQIKLLANSIEEVSTNIGSLPFYGGFFKIQINGKIEPEILFNKDSLPSKLKETITIQEKTTIKIIPRNIIVGIIIFLIIFFLIRHFKKRRLQQPSIKINFQ